MTLENTVLQKLGEPATIAGRHEFHVPDTEGGWNVYLTVDRRDDLSCLLWDLTLRRTAQADADLAGWASGISERTLALTERLKVIEVDAGRKEALLRTTPVQRVEKTFYFEAMLHGTEAITLRRYLAPRDVGERREQVSFALTNETLARLVGELTGA